jgi:RNA polymerase sigma-70 factor (ECF subfamily)
MSPPTISEAHVKAFHTVRPRLFGIAYRIVGSAAEADDVVQDAWIRWQETDRDAVRDAPAFLATATTRLAINVIQSARARRESHVGASVPHAIDVGADPALCVERRDALQEGALVLLEKLSPVERAAYVLREAFDYPHRQIAQVLGLTEANARQLVTRARMHLSSDRRRRVGAEEHARLVKALVCAAQTADLVALERFLVADAGPALEVAA